MQTIPPDRPTRRQIRFRHELLAFLRDVRRPRLSPRQGRSRQGSGLAADWQRQVPFTRLLAWAGFLWLVNMFALGPLAVAAAGSGGASHRMDIDNIPWLAALLWAPVVEEMLFRHGLRRPVQMLWTVPLVGVALFYGPALWTGALVALAIALALWQAGRRPAPLRCWRPALRRYVRAFPYVFHLATLAFAGLHLANFSLNAMPFWLMPLLVLPQWLTGLVLGWLRVRTGILDAMLLHGIFNAGPLLLVFLIVTLAPDMANL
ncbi:CPBP family intramembrane glutamic endopeptidase [Orrella sp. JC864]|uniref:CPBP family intramembrane glutamic endopeptidase n=1 Tax=Orrella sp. JC864 TaxID=3120298 RepID=UPI00300B54D9